MRRLTYYVATSADGFIAHADGSLGGFLMEGPHVADFLDSLAAYDTVLMGRATYELGQSMGVLSPYPAMQQYVFSTQWQTSPHPDVQLVSGDAIAHVHSLKAAAGGNIWLCGGSRLASSLMAAGLIDNVILKVNPVLFGQGMRLFAAWEGIVPLQLTDIHHFDNGVTRLHYQLSKA
ncbi:dihydrofolate reductase family protein [Leeia aquatica]|uniref:Dihydrofolate reductase n=1 Tax=Leeia aquatica TaxID=2725557 RepID=A0A847S380_9NEIS|nr:dihydrofolate reductase family protein [Leeia aquatica]NLR74253.1 dihydrofolate reductase [Leeia aquatica]